MPETKQLIRRVEITHEADVARMRRVLNANGYDAAPVDIEAAYKAWSLSKTPKPWHSPTYLNDLQLFDALMLGLTEPEAAPEPEATHADQRPQQDDGEPAEQEPAAAPERAARDLPDVPPRGTADRGDRRRERR